MFIYVDSSCDIQYSSYYIYGLYELYGKTNVKFSSKYFRSFKHDNHFFAFAVEHTSGVKKIVVDFTDSSIIDPTALDWCDVYGKINFDSSIELSTKVIPLGPSFGIQVYNLLETLWFAISNLFKSYARIPDKRKFLSDYKAQYKRPKLSDYHYQPTFGSYVFFMASLWKQEALTNQYRANFIEVCKQHQDIDFEGGFAPRTRNDMEGYETLTAAQRIEMRVYLEKTKDSILVFNTPAVKNCHGWKLAEYLCLGKAIISTSLSRIMPSPIENGKHLLITTGSLDDINEKIKALLLNESLRHNLESQAHLYFKTYLAPTEVIKRLINNQY